ncbi:MAG: Mth938-like domain-containing protein [Candidatus Aminicenantaceae bacterium]
MIDDYKFGNMVINRKSYNSDLIIYPDKTCDSWWRKSGHQLTMNDLEDVIKSKPEVLVIGTGYFGLMKVNKDVKDYSKSNDITLITEKTKKAVEAFNSVCKNKRTIGAFHLTC